MSKIKFAFRGFVEAIRLANPSVIIESGATSTSFSKKSRDKVLAIAKRCVPDAKSDTLERLKLISNVLGEYGVSSEKHAVPYNAASTATPGVISDDYFGILRNDCSPEFALELLVDALISTMERVSKDILSSGSELTEIELNHLLTLFLNIADIVVSHENL